MSDTEQDADRENSKAIVADLLNVVRELKADNLALQEKVTCLRRERDEANKERLEDRKVFEQSASLGVEAVQKLEVERYAALSKLDTFTRDCGALLRGIASLKSEVAIAKVPERVKGFLLDRKELHGSILRTCDGVEAGGDDK